MTAWVLAAVPLAYGIGTFPSALLVARTRGVDITASGSGNPGASNVGRVLGWRSGVAVFALDALKGAVCAAAGLVAGGRSAGYALGIAAVVGHIAPAWRGLRGGKGVATSGGAVIVLHPVVAAALLAAWLAASRLTGKAAIGSLLIAAGLPVGVALAGAPAWEVAVTAALSAVVVARHAGNVRRLVRGDEHDLRPSTQPQRSRGR